MSGIVYDKDKALRYSRQIILNEIGREGQDKLLKSKVLVVGVGGLGSPVLTYLAGAGIGALGIIDFDTVGISNLNRQSLFRTNDIGRKKVDVAEETLSKLNPDVKISKYPYRISIDNVEEIIQDYDVIVDALDNFPARYLLSDCCYFLKKPLIEGAAVGAVGTITTIIPDKTPCYRCIYPFPPHDGTMPTCSDVGILGMITGVIGSMQALETIKLIAGFGTLLNGRMIFFDGLDMEWTEIKYDKKDDCPLCGKQPSIKELVEYEIKCKLKTFE